MRINSLGISLTRRCNLNCIYCCSETGVDPPDKLTIYELKNLVLQAKALGAKWVIIPGEGEPFLDENLFPLIDFAIENGLRIKIFTNGLLIDRQTAAYLYRRNVAVVFKLHSLHESTYDLLAGKPNITNWTDYRTYKDTEIIKRIPQGLKNLLNAGYSRSPLLPFSESLLQIESIVVQQNLNCLPKVASLCKELGVNLLAETLIRARRSEKNASILMVPAKEELKIFDTIYGILGWKFKLQQKIRCRFETNPFFDISGNILHCFSLAADIGNIKEYSLAELHQKEILIRKEKGMISRKFSFNHHGFRCCTSRKVINENVTP